MKFQKPSRPNFFLDLCGAGEARLIGKATTSAAVGGSSLEARKWLNDVLELFANRAHISKGAAVQAFMTGDAGVEALMRAYIRRAQNAKPIGKRQLADDLGENRYAADGSPIMVDVYTPEDAFARKVTRPAKNKAGEEISVEAGIRNVLREAWTFAISLRKPGDNSEHRIEKAVA